METGEAHEAAAPGASAWQLNRPGQHSTRAATSTSPSIAAARAAFGADAAAPATAACGTRVGVKTLRHAQQHRVLVDVCEVLLVSVLPAVECGT